MSFKERKMTKREMNIRVFEKREIPQVLFQPRIEPWYFWHKQFGRLPEEYKDMNLLELYDELNLSMRYVHYYTGMPDPIEVEYTKKVRIREENKGDEKIKIIDTPYGELVQRSKQTVDKTWRVIGFPVKDKNDLVKLKWLYQNLTYRFNREKFERGSQFIGERGEPQFWLPKSPYQALCQQWMKLENFIYTLTDFPEKIEEVMRIIDDSYDVLYEEVISSGKVKIVNFGENIHAQLLSPGYFEKYLIPFYEKRVDQLRKAGIYTHIHIDGFFKPLLKYLRYLPFDGLEALTPLPQGDTSIEEIKENIGDKVLLDGIPAVLFLPHYSQEDLEKCVKKLIKLFYPRLILGISDELPEGANKDCIKRVKWVSNYCRTYFR